MMCDQLEFPTNLPAPGERSASFITNTHSARDMEQGVGQHHDQYWHTIYRRHHQRQQLQRREVAMPAAEVGAEVAAGISSGDAGGPDAGAPSLLMTVPLPAGWQVFYTTPDNGKSPRAYYYHEQLGQTSWQHPLYR